MQLHRNKWTLANMHNIDKQLYEIQLSAMMNMQKDKRNRELFFNYSTLLMATGMRRIEPFLRKVIIEKYIYNDHTYYYVTSAVAKHFDTKAKFCEICGKVLQSQKEQKEHKRLGHRLRTIGHRREVTTPWQASNEYDAVLFNYLLGTRNSVAIDFTPLLPPRFQEYGMEKLLKRYEKEQSNIFSDINGRFKVFKAMLYDPNKREAVEGYLSPHMLRHIKAFDLIVEHKYPPWLVQQLLHWDSGEMVNYYADIKNALRNIEIIQQYESMRAIP